MKFFLFFVSFQAYGGCIGTSSLLQAAYGIITVAAVSILKHCGSDVLVVDLTTGGCLMNSKMDRSHAVLSNTLELDAEDSQYWAAVDIKEKLQTITYLRECFYGTEATTGRLQRLYRFVERA